MQGQNNKTRPVGALRLVFACLSSSSSHWFSVLWLRLARTFYDCFGLKLIGGNGYETRKSVLFAFLALTVYRIR